MVALVSLLVVVTISILITRIASVALTHTGLSRESARFQARSALTGVGFTTSESENLVNHPVRRKILGLLMLVGNVGIITAVSTLILSFMDVRDVPSGWHRLVVLFGGLAALWFAARSQWLDHRLNKIISWALKRYTRLDVRDYASLLRLAGDYRVSEMIVEPGDWLANKSLESVRLSDEGMLVLGLIRENGRYLGAPRASTRIKAGDTLVLYGRAGGMDNLDQRRTGSRGDREHHEAVQEQQRVSREEEEAEKRAEEERKKQKG